MECGEKRGKTQENYRKNLGKYRENIETIRNTWKIMGKTLEIMEKRWENQNNIWKNECVNGERWKKHQAKWWMFQCHVCLLEGNRDINIYIINPSKIGAMFTNFAIPN